MSLYVQILALVFPSDPLAGNVLFWWEGEKISNILQSRYYPPLFSLLNALTFKLGLKDAFLWSLLGGIATLVLAVLAFYQYKPFALLVGLFAILFNFGAIRAPLSFWRETLIVWTLLLMTFCIRSLEKGTRLTFFSALFGALFGLGMLTKWTFWLYAVGFAIVAIKSVSSAKRLKFIAVATVAMTVVSAWWYLFFADYKLIFSSTTNDPSWWAPSFLARLKENLLFLFDAGGYSVSAFFILFPLMLVCRLTAAWTVISIALTLFVLALPAHIELRYLSPLVVPVGFALAELIQKMMETDKRRKLALLIVVAFVPFAFRDVFHFIPKFLFEEYVETKRFLPKAISAIAENYRGKQTLVAFNPWFDCHFCIAVNYLVDKRGGVIFERTREMEQFTIPRFNQRLESANYDVVINPIPIGLDIDNPEKVFSFSGIKRSELIFESGERVEMPGWDEFSKMLNNLNERYKLLFTDEIEGKKLEIWVRKK